MKFEIEQIAEVTGGRLCPETARGEVSGVSTDSRNVGDGELFVPLKGPNFDGHDFLIQAVRRGASACLSEEVVEGLPVPVIQVEDSLRALGDLAAAARLRLEGPVVAVTGSSGKTTTKEMLASILELTAPGLKTKGNFNNLVGLPLTLFGLEEKDRWAVLEMGMSARGEIARLAEIAAPLIGIVTNVGPAHLDTLRTVDGVARAKGELFAALPKGGTAIINADDEKVAALPVANGVRRVLFGTGETAEVRAENIVVEGSSVAFLLRLGEEEMPVRLSVAGRHNVLNALAAAAAAGALGVEAATIAAGLEAFRPVSGRMETIRLEGGVLLLEDSYNANPLSVEAALAALDEIGTEGRRIAALGDMLELGEASAELHRRVGKTAAARADLLLLFGKMAPETAAGARRAGMAEESVRIFSGLEELSAYLPELLESGDRLLVKGSRSMKMEKIVAALKAHPASGNS